MKNKQNLLRLKMCALALSGALSTSLVGCSVADATESETNSKVNQLILEQTDMNDIENGVTQTLDVPNNNFNIVINYNFNLLENEKWTVCDNKNVTLEIKTKNLKKGMKVYVDNIHMDTFILSTKSYFNDILQDTMDDSVHNSSMLGFPISNNVSYIGFSQIRGQSDMFLNEYASGVSGYNSKTIPKKRRTESDYLSEGVYANKISSVIDLIIIDENDVTSCVSVHSSLIVPIWPFVKFKKRYEEYYIYYYIKDNKINSKSISSEEYSFLINNNGYSRTLK